MGFPVAQWLRIRLPVQETQARSLVGKIPWRRQWQPIPASLPGESHGQSGLAGVRELDATERLITLTGRHIQLESTR